jgi:hypothetical protein
VSANLGCGQVRIIGGEPARWPLTSTGSGERIDMTRSGGWGMAHGAHRGRRRLVATGLAALAVLAVPSAAQAGGSILAVSPHHLKFGRQPFGSFTTRTVTITNRSSRTLAVTITDQSPDDFSRPANPDPRASSPSP